MTTFAFALPFALPLATSARPLATEAPEAGFCWGDDCDDGGEPIAIDLALCVAVALGVETRECEVRKGPACLAACTFDAVGPACLAEVGDRAAPRQLAACEADSVAVCRSQCDAGGAAFCQLGDPEPEARGDERDRDSMDPHLDEGSRRGEHDDGDGGVVLFVDLLACIGIGIDAG